MVISLVEVVARSKADVGRALAAEIIEGVCRDLGRSEGKRIEIYASKSGLRNEARLLVGIAEMMSFAHPQIVTGFRTRRKKNSFEEGMHLLAVKELKSPTRIPEEPK